MAPENQATPRHDTHERLAYTLAILAIWLWFMLQTTSWPELYTVWFSLPGGEGLSFWQVPVHLYDDVMIQMRAGEVLLRTGVPSMNFTDLAQPSTSLLTPYIAAALLWMLPPNLAALALAGLGLLAATGTLLTIIWFARSPINGAVLALLLALTTTSGYALNGWDHLFQAFFLTLATALTLRQGEKSKGMLLGIAALLALGCLARLDGLLIAGALLVTLLLTQQQTRRVTVWAALPFMLVMGGALALNFAQFGHLSPTTSRLKIGAAPSISYVVDHLLDNGVRQYSAITFFFFVTLIAVFNLRFLGGKKLVPLVSATSITGLIAALNSDVFTSGRMYWTPAAVLAAGLAVLLPALVEPRLSKAKETRTRLVLPVLITCIAAMVVASSLSGLQRATIGHEGLATRTAENFVLAQWINANLNPDDGAIGLFWAGTAFHLPDFEVADFLGKGDELIAVTQVKQGPPGHNKWDIAATLDKWNPQAIIPTGPEDPTTPSARAAGQAMVNSESAFAYKGELVLNEEIRSNYSWCEVVKPQIANSRNLGILLRNDVAQAVVSSSPVTCRGFTDA